MHSPTHLRGVTLAPPAARGKKLHAFQPGLGNKLARVAWGIVCVLLFRPSPRPLHAWRAFLLRCFGAQLGPACHIYPAARIWAPWNLACMEGAAIADDAVIYNPARVLMGEYAIVSQEAYVCTATHDFDDPAFPMVVAPITLGARAWVCARACVLPGISIGDGAVLGLAAVATRDLEPWQVYAGNPARKLKTRRRERT